MLLLGPTNSISVSSAGYVCRSSFSSATSARSGLEKGIITLMRTELIKSHLSLFDEKRSFFPALQEIATTFRQRDPWMHKIEKEIELEWQARTIHIAFPYNSRFREEST